MAAASKLFIDECKSDDDQDVLDFIEYFEDEWIKLNPNWFEGYNNPNNVPSQSTNNGNESLNDNFKAEDTLRERLPMPEYLACILSAVNKWSCRRDPLNINCKHFLTQPPISLELWTAAFKWKQTTRILLCTTYPDCYYVSATDGVEIDSLEVILEYEKQMSQCNWKNFEQFTNCALGYWKIEMKSDLNWINGKCTCPAYFKHYICKHMVGIAIKKIKVYLL